MGARDLQFQSPNLHDDLSVSVSRSFDCIVLSSRSETYPMRLSVDRRQRDIFAFIQRFLPKIRRTKKR